MVVYNVLAHVIFVSCGCSEAGCTPLTASIIADRFGKRSRALAMSIFNWGIYIGYGLAFTVGNYVTAADILGQVSSKVFGRFDVRRWLHNETNI